MPAAVMSWAAPAALGAVGMLQQSEEARRQRNAKQQFMDSNQWMPEFLKNNYGLLNDQLSFAKELQPQFQSLIQRFLASNDPGRMEADINRTAGQNLGLAGQNALSSDAMLRSLGIGSGARGGNVAANYNQAANQTNQYANYRRSPEGMSAQLQGSIGAIGQGQSMSALNPQLMASSAWTDAWRAMNSGGGGGGGGVLGSLLGGLAQGAVTRGAKTASPNASLNQAFPTSNASGLMQKPGDSSYIDPASWGKMFQGKWGW